MQGEAWCDRAGTGSFSVLFAGTIALTDVQLSCTSFTCVFLCVYDKVGVLLILLIFSFHVTSYWCLSAIIKDTKECTVINDCSLMTFSCNSEGGWVGLCTALIGQLGCYVASFQSSSLQANGCCACVGLLEGLSLPLLRVLTCIVCCVSKLAISSAVCVCVYTSCVSTVFLPFSPSPPPPFTAVH